MSAVARSGAELLPVDSEHSAVLQALAGSRPGGDRADRADRVRRAVPDLGHGAARRGHAGAGAEASQLDDGPQDHDQFRDHDEQGPGADRGLSPVPGRSRASSTSSCIRSRSCTASSSIRDGSVLAQLASPDMRTPIACAWRGRRAWPRRPRASIWSSSATLDFRGARRGAVPGAGAGARRRWQRRRSAPAVLNAANEIAVEAFLAGRIGFLDIAATVERCLEAAGRAGHRACNMQVDRRYTRRSTPTARRLARRLRRADAR